MARFRGTRAVHRGISIGLAAALLLPLAACHRKRVTPPVAATLDGRPARAVPAAKAALAVKQNTTATQTPGGALPPVAGPVELQPQPDVLAGEVAAFPRVLPGPAVSPRIAAMINAALTRDEAAAKKTALECRSDAKQEQPDLSASDVADSWQRSVDVTMRGPRFVSYTMGTTYSCGGAYMEIDRESSIVYDLTTGHPVNWLRLLPRGTKAVTGGDLGDGLPAGWLAIPYLQRRARQEAEPDCKDLFDTSYGAEVSFEVYPDARDGVLVVSTPDLPHAMRNCETALTLHAADLQRFGAPPALPNAIAAAAALQPPH